MAIPGGTSSAGNGYPMHASDPEAMLLAGLAGTIRRDRKFWGSFGGRLDELLQAQEICFRGPDSLNCY